MKIDWNAAKGLPSIEDIIIIIYETELMNWNSHKFKRQAFQGWRQHPTFSSVIDKSSLKCIILIVSGSCLYQLVQ